MSELGQGHTKDREHSWQRGPCAALLPPRPGVLTLSSPPPSSGLQTALVVLVLPSLAWLLALLAVNSDAILFHYLFAISNCLQVLPPT